MTTFDSREKAFEDKFAHDEAMLFKARARRDRLFGEWAASEMGLPAVEATEFAKKLVAVDLAEAGDEDILRYVETVLGERGLEFTRHQLEKHLEDFFTVAKQQIAEGK